MYITEAITANILAVSILACVLLNARGKPLSDGNSYKWLLKLIRYNLALCLVETLSVMVDGRHFQGVELVAKLINSASFLLNIFFAERWLECSYIRMFGEYRFLRKKRRRLMVLLPTLPVIVLVIVNLFTPVLFSIDPETGLYERMPLFAVAAAISYGYLLWGALLTFFNRKKMQKYMLGSVVYFLLPVCIGSLVQMLLVGISIMWAGAALGVLSMYLCMQDESAFIDELSGVYSRNYLINHLSARFSRKEDDTVFAGIMMDVDTFKSINDQHGHLAGDAAILNFGRILRSSVPSNMGFASRYGGDEFVVILSVTREEEACAVLSRIRASLEEFNEGSEYPFALSISAGYTFYQKGDTQEAFIQRMDAEMYKDKYRQKEA